MILLRLTIHNAICNIEENKHNIGKTDVNHRERISIVKEKNDNFIQENQNSPKSHSIHIFHSNLFNSTRNKTHIF